MPNVSAETLHGTMTFLRERLREGQPDEAVRLELLARGFEEKLAELYEQFQRSECSFDYVAEQLGVSTWDLYDLLEQHDLRTTNL